MKNRLDNLPAGKRRELEFVVETLRAGFAESLKRRTMQRFRNGKLLKIVLFGSYARGDWVEDPKGRYFSDYDILVVVNHKDLTDLEEFWGKPDDALMEALSSGEQLRTQVNFVVHSLEDVNEQLRMGRYFFTDLVRDGITLFEEDGFPFGSAEALSPKDAYGQTVAYYQKWFKGAWANTRGASFYRQDGSPHDAAFSLHQAAERFYHGLILVMSLYSSKTHRLNLLRNRAEEMDNRLVGLWGGDNKFERQCFDLIRRAYVDARYSTSYEISAEQLDWLEATVARLGEVAETIAQERLAVLRQSAN